MKLHTLLVVMILATTTTLAGDSMKTTKRIPKTKIIELIMYHMIHPDIYIMLEDEQYILKNEKYYLNNPWYGAKILPYTKMAFDCGKRSVYHMNYMFNKLRKEKLKWISSDAGGGSYPALPFGIMKYKDQRFGWHIINFAVVGDIETNIDLLYIERQRNGWIEKRLTPDELDTVSYMMIF